VGRHLLRHRKSLHGRRLLHRGSIKMPWALGSGLSFHSRHSMTTLGHATIAHPARKERKGPHILERDSTTWERYARTHRKHTLEACDTTAYYSFDVDARASGRAYTLHRTMGEPWAMGMRAVASYCVFNGCM